MREIGKKITAVPQGFNVHKTVQRFLIQGKPTEVQANDGTIPETQASVHITRLDSADESSSSSSQSTPPQQ